jgi:prephenate dehydrogenase
MQARWLITFHLASPVLKSLQSFFRVITKHQVANFKLPKCNGELFHRLLTGDWQMYTLMFRQEKNLLFRFENFRTIKQEDAFEEALQEIFAAKCANRLRNHACLNETDL